MNKLPNSCPICGGEFVVRAVQCRECDTQIEGRFQQGAFARVSEEQLAFIELFVRNEGKITRMESDRGLSYPTIRNRLHEVIRALGYEPNEEDEFAGLSDEERKKILDDLEQGSIDYDEALRLIEERE